MIKTTNIKQKLLISELRDALKSSRKCSDSEILNYCNLTRDTLDDDIAFALPLEALRFHYYMLGVRAFRARQAGQIPNGASFRLRVAACAKTITKKK